MWGKFVREITPEHPSLSGTDRRSLLHTARDRSIKMCFSCSTVTCCCFKTRMGNKCLSRDVIQHEMLIHSVITQRPRRVRWDYVRCHCVWFNLSRYFPGNSILLHLGAGGSRDVAHQRREANTSLSGDVFTKAVGEMDPKAPVCSSVV